ncbi:MAG: polyphosphate polymerase domain-containing protein [Anaerolineae bacterium]|nr:polyphosphate polymerase domain-containing protein [Anaerolineae bacterium]
MSTTVEPVRYEIKLPCAPHVWPQIEAWVRLHPAHWRATYPSRQVNNVYFDTPDCRALNDNLSGAGDRSKLRLRWYGTPLHQVARARLELKRKEGMVGWKEICPVDVSLDLAACSWDEAERCVYAAAGETARLWMGRFPQPVLVNHYWRAYYATPDGEVRLTVDTRLCAYDQRASALPNLRRPAPIVDRVVVELKAPAERNAYRRLSDALAHFPLRPDRHSKYVNSMLAAPDFDGISSL